MHNAPQWVVKQAQQMMWEAQQVDAEQGIQLLVAGLLLRMKAENNKCVGHGACIATGQCPLNCNGE